jgi:hypothetical protein
VDLILGNTFAEETEEGAASPYAVQPVTSGAAEELAEVA